MHVDIIIPVRSYLKKFIANSREVEPFILSLSRCHFSAVILEPIKKGYKKVSLKESDHLNDELKIRMGSSVMKENKYFIDNYTVMSIDFKLKSMFDQQLVDYITINNSKKGDIKESIQMFMDHYGISEDDLKWETITKMYYRARHGVPSSKKEKMDEICKQMALDI